MEDFPVLLIFFLFYLIVGSAGKKKQRRRAGRVNPGPKRTRMQGEQMDLENAKRDMQTLEGFEAAFGDSAARTDHACAEQRIHLHEVSQTQMHLAGEGEDPCHGGDSAAQSAFDTAEEEDDAQLALRQDVLRGVIMSEILMRPHERRALKRKEYHG